MIWLHKNDNGRALVPDSVVLPRKADAAFIAGTALVLSGGVAVAATGETKPQYICYSNNAANDGSELIAYAVSDTMRFEAPLTAYAATVVPGAKLNLSTDGKGVTATAGGHCVVVDTNGAKAIGDKIIIKFE